MSQFLIYAILICYLLGIEYSKKLKLIEKRKPYFIGLLLFLLFFFILRYDTTYDYIVHVELFSKVRQGCFGATETAYALLSKLFSFSKYGYVFVIGLTSILGLFAFNTLFKYKKLGIWGWFYAITFLVVFMLTNQIRQGAALGAFVYAIYFLDRRKYLYTIPFLLLACAFHYSAAICLVFLPLAFFMSRVELNKWIWFGVLLATFVLYIHGDLFQLVLKVLSVVPRYGSYADSEFFNKPQERNTGLGILLMTAVGICLIFVKDFLDSKHRMYYNMAILYFILFVALSDIGVVLRITRYLYVFLVVTLALIMKNKKMGRIVKFAFVLASLIWWGRYMYLLDRPFKTIFSQDRIEGRFYMREWGSGTADRYLDKSYIYDFEER